MPELDWSQLIQGAKQDFLKKRQQAQDEAEKPLPRYQPPKELGEFQAAPPVSTRVATPSQTEMEIPQAVAIAKPPTIQKNAAMPTETAEPFSSLVTEPKPDVKQLALYDRWRDNRFLKTTTIGAPTHTPEERAEGMRRADEHYRNHMPRLDPNMPISWKRDLMFRGFTGAMISGATGLDLRDEAARMAISPQAEIVGQTIGFIGGFAGMGAVTRTATGVPLLARPGISLSELAGKEGVKRFPRILGRVVGEGTRHGLPLAGFNAFRTAASQLQEGRYDPKKIAEEAAKGFAIGWAFSLTGLAIPQSTANNVRFYELLRQAVRQEIDVPKAVLDASIRTLAESATGFGVAAGMQKIERPHDKIQFDLDMALFTSLPWFFSFMPGYTQRGSIAQRLGEFKREIKEGQVLDDLSEAVVQEAETKLGMEAPLDVEGQMPHGGALEAPAQPSSTGFYKGMDLHDWIVERNRRVREIADIESPEERIRQLDELEAESEKYIQDSWVTSRQVLAQERVQAKKEILAREPQIEGNQFAVDPDGEIVRIVGWNTEENAPIVVYLGKEGGKYPSTQPVGVAGRHYEYVLKEWRPANAADFKKKLRPSGTAKMLDLRKWQDEFSQTGQTQVVVKTPSGEAVSETKARQKQVEAAAEKVRIVQIGGSGKKVVNFFGERKSIEISEEFPWHLMELDPDALQFKVSPRARRGKALESAKRWDVASQGIITLWRSPDGKYKVANGHQRVVRAKELAEEGKGEDIPKGWRVQILDSKDWTIQQARTLGALINIREGSLSTGLEDIAVFLRNSKLTAEDLANEGIAISDSRIRDGIALSKVHDIIFNETMKGQFPKQEALIIGRELGDNITAQISIYKTIKRLDKTGKSITGGKLQELIRLGKRSKSVTEQQEGLFGITEIQRANLAEQAELIDHVKKELRKDKRLFGTVVREKARLEEGGTVVDAETGQEISGEAARFLDILDRLAYSSGTSINKSIQEHAATLNKTNNKAEVKKNAYTEIKSAIAEEYSRIFGRGKAGGEVVERTGKERPAAGLFDQGNVGEVEKPKTKPTEFPPPTDSMFGKQIKFYPPHIGLGEDYHTNYVDYGLRLLQEGTDRSVVKQMIRELALKHIAEGTEVSSHIKPIKPTNPQVAQAIDAAKRPKRFTLKERLQATFEEGKRLARHYPEIETKRSPEFAWFHDWFRRVEAIRSWSSLQAAQDIYLNVHEIQRDPGRYSNFLMGIYWGDLLRYIDTGKFDLPEYKQPEHVQKVFREINAINQQIAEATKKKDIAALKARRAELRKTIRNDILLKPLPHRIPDRAYAEREWSRIMFEDGGVMTDPVTRRAYETRQQKINGLRDTAIEYGLLPPEVAAYDEYLHHKVLEYMELRGQNMAGISSEHAHLRKRPYQFRRIGSSKDYSVDYLIGEHEVVSQIYAQIKLIDALREIRGSGYDLTDQLKADYNRRLEGLYEEIGGDISAFFADEIEMKVPGHVQHNRLVQEIERLKPGIVKEQGLDQGWEGLIPSTHQSWQPQEGRHIFNANVISERVVDQILRGELVDPDQIKRLPVLGAKKPVMVLPKEVVSTLDKLTWGRDLDPASNFAASVIRLWKKWTLLSPERFVKYNLNNLSGDADIAMAISPQILSKYSLQAAKDTWKFTHAPEKLPPDIRKEISLTFEYGVGQSGFAGIEVGRLSEARIRALMTGKNINLFVGKTGYWPAVQDFTQWRENVLRVASYRYFRDQIKSGKNPYGASRPWEIDAIKDPEKRAAKLAREAIGDYGNISVAGQWLRSNMLPFYSWLEINLPRYVRLIRNLPLEAGGASKSMQLAGIAGKKGLGLAGRATWKAGSLLLKANILFAAVAIWNKTFFPDEWNAMIRSGDPQYKLILPGIGGETIKIRFEGAMSDALEWFGKEDLIQDVQDLVRAGKMGELPRELGRQVKETALAPLQRLYNALNPFAKIPIELALQRSLYPDFRYPRPIRDPWQNVARLLSADIPYDYIAGKPHKSWKEMVRLVGYTSDPGEAAYYVAKNLTHNRMKKLGKRDVPTIIPDKRMNALYNYRKAVKNGNDRARDKYLRQYLELTPGAVKAQKLAKARAGIKASIQRLHPLYGLNPVERIAFRNGLTVEEKEIVDRAIEWYQEIYQPGKPMVQSLRRNRR